MAIIQDLIRYQNHTFSSCPYTGSDYIILQKKYINYLKSICKANGWEVCKVMKNHYCFSAFIQYRRKYIYLSISDVRWNQDWLNRILYRTATSENDYTGGQNRYTCLDRLEYALETLFERMCI